MVTIKMLVYSSLLFYIFFISGVKSKISDSSDEDTETSSESEDDDLNISKENWDCSQLPNTVGFCLNLKNPSNQGKIYNLITNMIVKNSRFISSKLPPTPITLISWGLPISFFLITSYDVPMSDASFLLTSSSHPKLRDNELYFSNDALLASGCGYLFYFFPFNFHISAGINFLTKICIPFKNNLSLIYSTRLKFLYVHLYFRTLIIHSDIGFVDPLLNPFIMAFMDIFKLLLNTLLFLFCFPFAMCINQYIGYSGKPYFSKEDEIGVPNCPQFRK